MFVTVLFMSSSIFNSKNSFLYFIRSSIISAILLSFIGIAQYYFNYSEIPGGYGWPYGTMANGNLFASALLLFLPFVLYGVFSFTGYWRTISTISMSAVFLNIILTQTRAVWVAVIFSVCLLFLFLIGVYGKSIFSKLMRFNVNRRITQPIMILVLTSAVGMISINYLNPVERVQDTLFSITNLEDPAVYERLSLWKKSTDMIMDSPFLGVGKGNWKIQFPNYGTEGMRAETGYTNFQRPHNDYLWVLSETGVLGFLSYLMIFIVSLYYGIKFILPSNRVEKKLLMVCLIFGLTGYMVSSFFSYPMERIFHTVFLAIILGGILSLYHGNNLSKQDEVQSPNYLLNLLIVCGIILSVWIGLFQFRTETHVLNALRARQKSQWKSLIREVDKANSTFFPLDHTATPLLWYRGVANFSLDNMDTAFRDFQSAYQDNPNHVHVLNNLATVYEMKGNHQEAIKLYSRAIEISPKFVDAIINLAAVQYNLGHTSEAYETIRKIDNNNNPKYLQYLDAIQKKIGTPP
jgi:O-antigen ligase